MGRSLKVVGNEGNPNKLGVFAQSVKMGSALQLVAQTVSGAVSGDVIVLPDTAKGLIAISGYASAGGTTGALVGVVGAPATGEFSVDVDGNLAFNNGDAVTVAEVVYTVVEGDVVSASAVIAGGAALLPGESSARQLLSVTADGNSRTVLARGAAPAAGQAAISNDGLSVLFNAADNGLLAVVSYIELPSESVGERLTGDVDF